jgi:RNA polymerase sigma factor (sigma-70 family)
MNQPERLTVLADRFETWTWDLSAPELQDREDEFLEECAGGGVCLDRVLAEQSDETLALAVQKRFCGKAAFVELFVTRYGPDLLRWFSRWERNYRRDYHRELDLAQELVLKFLKDPAKLDRYDPSRTFAHWLHVVARNLWIAQVVRRHQPQPTDVLPEAAVGITPEEELFARELSGRLDEALPRLPPDRRQVMELTLQGLLPGDIARQLGWPIRKVYRVLCQARKWLIEELSLSPPPSPRGRPKRPGPESPEPGSSDT